jgi:MtrB/PioB family decaheme-associated outer membrane protein
MRRFVLILLVSSFAFAMPAPAHGQSVTQTPAAQTPAAPASSGEEAPRSLFAPTWHQFLFAGRLSSVSGDPARWQRYQDLRDGVLFSDARIAREDPAGNWQVRGTADNVGWRDQRYFGEYERTGRLKLSGLWDQIPQFYSVDTATPYANFGGALVLDDATQRAIQNGQAKLSAWIPLAPQFDLRERRDIGNIAVAATPTTQFDVNSAFTTIRHRGELPWGASFGFGNDVEVALPYDSRTNDFTVGAEWTNASSMLRAGYEGSWFDNLDPILVWDSPLRLDDSPSAPGRGRTTLWPTNSAQTVSFAGYRKFARRTQLTGYLSFGSWSSDEPLQPFTINSALPQIALPRNSAQGEAKVFSTNLNLSSHPARDWRFNARLREYDYTNDTPSTVITQYVSYDTSVGTSSTGGPELFAHSRTTFDADATWSGLLPLALTAGYTHNSNGYDFRIFESSGENVLRLTADAAGWQMVTFRAQYEYGDRTGSGLDEARLVEIGEQPALRHYDLANRTRNRFSGQIDVVPDDAWTFSFSTGLGKDDYKDTDLGLQDARSRTFSFGADYQHPHGVGAGFSYNYEHYAALQRSRQSSSLTEFADPNRDWSVDPKETVNYFSIYASPPKFGPNTEARVSYDYSLAKGTYPYSTVPGGPLVPPNQLPEVFNKLQQLHVDVRHRVSSRLAASFSYLYEPFRVYDFAFDQSVVDSIVQPSSLVLGYIYRPYTAHSFVFGLRYFW